MSEFKGTPGPWFVTGKHDTAEIRYVGTDPDNRFIGEVATLFGKEDEEQQANALLIAAAPDLREALEAFIEYEKACEAGDDVGSMLVYAEFSKMARAAIAKATEQL